MKFLRTFILIGFFLLAGYFHSAECQLYINEFSASNSSINQDPDYGEFADWVEIYNSGQSVINLKNYFLTDNKGIPNKWQIVENVLIDAGGFILIWADDMNSGLHANFKLSADGEEIALFSPGLVLLDSLSFSFQKTDISAGRKLDGADVWGYFINPTPGASNTASVFFADFAKNKPVFSVTGGIYETGFTLELSNPLGGEIRYELDGSEPNDESEIYTFPLSVSSNTIVRARIFKPGMIPGPVVTHSYFLDGDLKSRKLPVVSISTDPINLWDPQKGIYVQNFKPLWEIPANIELFENNGSDRAAFNEQAGIKVNGLYSWQLPQKMLGIYFRGQYGVTNLEYPLLYHKQRSNYKDFALRASGSDWSYTLFRDILGQDASRLNTKLDFMDFRPSIAFFNGEYMGIHNIREKVNSDFIEKNYNLEPGTFDIIENEDYAEAGDLLGYRYFQSLYSKDLSIYSNYSAVSEVMDIENFTDLVITEMATANYSIDHNVMAWKPKDSGKWKWVIMDLDRGFFNITTNMISFYTQQNSWPFQNLMNNEEYIRYFGQRLADQLFTGFHPQRMKMLIESHAADISNEVPFHVERWLGATSSYGNAIPSQSYWINKVNDLKTFTELRPGFLLNDLSNYGFSGFTNLYLSVKPSGAGTILINNLIVPDNKWVGLYLKDISTKFTAVDKAGYNFKGWKNSEKKIFIPKSSFWKYLDNGSDQGTAWKDPGYNDLSWKSGPAQLGYGEDDEATVIDYGGSTTNRYITTYFRKKFNLTSEDLESSGFIISLLKDDGAAVYINGNEVLRSNLPYGLLSHQTYTPISISGNSESFYTCFYIDPSYLIAGENLIAVELHQNYKNSNDLSFDLEFAGLTEKASGYLTTNRDIYITISDDTFLSAEYEPIGQCIIPAIISGDLTLDKECSPYLVLEDITIKTGCTLKIMPGVEIWLSPKSNIHVEGSIEALGNSSEPIFIKTNPEFGEASWGAMTFLNATDTSRFSFVTIESASEGKIPSRDYAAISSFNSNLVLDHLVLEDVDSNPIIARYSDIVLTNSSLHSRVSGDLINVKYGTARIENSVFRGNDQMDTDGIDYDGITGGIIRNCKLYDFLGFNCDAVDIGENSMDLIIDSLTISNVFDKGISVGQNSSVNISNTLFVNCMTGLGLKDQSEIKIDHCSFYGNNIPVSCYEKNPGSAGGIAELKNSIMSNSSYLSYFSDSYSSLSIRHCISDNTPLPSEPGNLFGNPLFKNPVQMDFALSDGSPAIFSGEDSGVPTDMGSRLNKIEAKPFPMIFQIYTNPLNTVYPEFIKIFNPSSEPRDLSHYSVSKGITHIFPAGTILEPNDYLILTSDAGSSIWYNSSKIIQQWTEGKLSNSGEAIELLENHNLIIDFIEYSNDGKWPEDGFIHGEVMIMKNTETDNHFGENWYSETIAKVFNRIDSLDSHELILYPNPSFDRVNIIVPVNELSDIYIYSIEGKLIDIEKMNQNGFTEVELAKYDQRILILRIGENIRKVILLK